MKDEQKKDLKFIIIFVLILTLSFSYLMQTSLAKYRKQSSANVNVNIAKWEILVNKEDISNKTVLTSKITPIIDENEYVKKDFIAPGSTGYCDIIIDASNVDVDFKYELTPDTSTSAIADLIITDYIINPTETNSEKIAYDNNTTITGNIKKNSSNNVIRLYIIWEEENGTMDNKKDTEVATKNKETEINVKLKFEQQTN